MHAPLRAQGLWWREVHATACYEAELQRALPEPLVDAQVGEWRGGGAETFC